LPHTRHHVRDGPIEYGQIDSEWRSRSAVPEPEAVSRDQRNSFDTLSHDAAAALGKPRPSPGATSRVHFDEALKSDPHVKIDRDVGRSRQNPPGARLP
jgi:hypothetical protein